MKLIFTCISLCLLNVALIAQDPVPTAPAQDTVPVVEPAQEAQPAVAPEAAPAAVAAQPAAQPEPQAQAKKPAKKSNAKQKVYYGGYVNFSFGTYTSVGIEPMIGYKIIPRLSVGAKIRYDYVKYKGNSTSPSYDYSNYGGSIFARLSVIRQLYLHAEYAGYNYPTNYGTESEDRLWVPYLFLGGGFNQPIGGRASLNAQILFDVLHNENSPYGSWEPFYSVGVSVGF